jgi:hypothetical protein
VVHTYEQALVQARAAGAARLQRTVVESIMATLQKHGHTDRAAVWDAELDRLRAALVRCIPAGPTVHFAWFCPSAASAHVGE